MTCRVPASGCRQRHWQAMVGGVQQAGGVLLAGNSFSHLLGTFHVLLLRKAW